MKKLLFLVAGTLLFIPVLSFAAMQSLNGLSNANQTFATTTAATSTMHLRISSPSGGSIHNFLWDGTPWLLNQGGTGTTSFATGSVPFIFNSRFSESTNLSWDGNNEALSLGGATSSLARLTITATSTQAAFKILTSLGTNAFFVTSDGKIGIGTTAPSEQLEVVGNIKASGTLQANSVSVTGATSSAISGSLGLGNTNPQHKLDISGAYYSRRYTLTDGGTVSVDWNNANVQSVVLGGNRTLTFANGQDGGQYSLILKQDGTGGRTVTWPATVKWPGGTAPTLTATANAIDVVGLVFDGTSYLGSSALNEASPASIVDNFNSYSDGDLAGNNGGSGWSAAWSGSANHDVQGTVTYEGAKAVQNSVGTGNISRTFTSRSSGVVRVAMRRSSNGSGQSRILAEDSGGTTQYAVEMASTGQFVLKSTEGDTNVAAYSADTWYVVDLEFDTSVPRQRARIDNGTWSAWKAPFAGSATNNVNKVYFDENSTGVDNYWDDVEL
jgi:hypothetical protein